MARHKRKNKINTDYLNLFSEDQYDWVNNKWSKATDPFPVTSYKTMGNRIKTSMKQLGGGQSTPGLASYSYPNHNKKTPHKAGSKIPITENVKAPNGMHWQNTTSWNNHYVLDYENSDIYNDFDGKFFLEKIGNKFHCWINLVDSHVIDVHGQPSHEITGYSKPIAEATWVDTDKSKSFALASIAAYFAKHNIYEDTTQNPHAYHDVNMGVRSVKYWNIFDGGNDVSKPHIIAHKGENIIIDTGKMKVYNTDGTDLTKYTSFESAFPPLLGGQINNIDFYPTVGTNCDVDVTYVPRIR